MASKTPEAEGAAAAPKSKKMLLLVIIGVVVLALAGVGGWLFLSKKHAAAEDEEEEEVAHVVEATGPPTYLPLENMVVNLADPGGERVAQVGVTFELNGGPLAVDKVKVYLPSIRSEVLMLVSQRTAEELLKREGKEQLAADIMTEASKHFGPPASGKKSKKKGKDGDGGNPIRGVLFSSFIVQ